MRGKIQNFTDLEAWKKGHELFILVYQYTNAFPKSELFGFTNQLRRAALSITSNIAEGFGRSSTKEKIQFYYVAHGSILEVQNQLIAAKDIGLITNEQLRFSWEKTVITQKLTNGLIKSLKSSLA